MDKRGNLRHDAGYTGANQTDASVVTGMYFPRRMVGPSRRGGVCGDATMDHTLFKSGCSVMKMADCVSTNHPLPKTKMAGEIFADNQRNSLFGGRWADDLGMGELKQWARFDATSCFGTGETSDWRIHKTERHKDDQNSKHENENHCPTFTKVVVVRYPNGVEVAVRLGINVYEKGCCSDTKRQLMVNDLILTAVRNDKGPSGMCTRLASERDGTPTPVIKVRYVHAVKGKYREGRRDTCRSREPVHVRAAVILSPNIGNKLLPAPCTTTF